MTEDEGVGGAWAGTWVGVEAGEYMWMGTRGGVGKNAKEREDRGETYRYGTLEPVSTVVRGRKEGSNFLHSKRGGVGTAC